MPIEILPGRKAETDRVREGISEGYSAWQSPKWPFREALKRKGLPPHRLLQSISCRRRSSSPFVSRWPFVSKEEAKLRLRFLRSIPPR